MTPDPLHESAIAWFVRTHSDQRTLADDDRFEQWLKEDPRHPEAYALVERLWRAAGPQIRPSALAKRKTKKAWIGGVAAALVLAAMGAAVILQGRGPISSGKFGTEAGAQRELALSDGSTIILNTRSEVIVDIGERQRSVRLLRGEARFKVAKDSARPFSVDAGVAQVRALGTSFDVRRSSVSVDVTLLEGRVEVIPSPLLAPRASPAVLAAGQQLSLKIASGERSVETVDLRAADAWLRNQLLFDAVPLPAAVEEANRYLETPIVIADPALAQIRVSGVVRTGSVDSFIDALESSFPIEALGRSEGQVRLVGRAKPAASRD